MPSEYAKDIRDIRDNVVTLVERSKNTDKLLEKLNGTVTTLDGVVADNCTDIAKLQERQGMLAGINTALTLVAASLAAWIGTRR